MSSRLPELEVNQSNIQTKNLNYNSKNSAKFKHPNSDIEKVTQKCYPSEISLEARTQTQRKIKTVLNSAVAGKSRAKSKILTDPKTTTSSSTSIGNKKSFNRNKKLSLLDAFSIYKKKGFPKRFRYSTNFSKANPVNKYNKTGANNINHGYKNINKEKSKELIEQKEVLNLSPSYTLNNNPKLYLKNPVGITKSYNFFYPNHTTAGLTSPEQVFKNFNLIAQAPQFNHLVHGLTLTAQNRNSTLKLDSNLINYLSNSVIEGEISSGLTSTQISSLTPSLSMPLAIRKTNNSIPLTSNYFNTKYIADLPRDNGKLTNQINKSSSGLLARIGNANLVREKNNKLSLRGSTRIRKLKMLKLALPRDNYSRFNHSIKQDKSGAGKLATLTKKRFNKANKKYFYYIFPATASTKEKNKKRLNRLTKRNLNYANQASEPFSIQRPVEVEQNYSGLGNNMLNLSSMSTSPYNKFKVNGKKLNILKNLNYFNLLNKGANARNNMKSFKDNYDKLISSYIFKIQNKKNNFAFKNLIRREGMNFIAPIFSYFDIINLNSRIERHRILNSLGELTGNLDRVKSRYLAKDNLHADRLKELDLTKREIKREQGLLSISTPFFNVLSGLSLIRNINKSLNYYRLKKNNIIGSFILFNLIYKQYLNKINKQELNKDKGLVQGLTLNA